MSIRKRRQPPLKVKLEAALLQLGLDPATAQLDHDPALGLRKQRTVDGVIIYDPDEHDPHYLRWLGKPAHAEKTTGRRGTSKLSRRGGDVTEIAKLKRIEEKHQAYRARLLADHRAMVMDFFTKASKAHERPKTRWPKRKFATRAKPERTKR